ncbi:8654_t:CDS:1, partial [Dentiscutata erythropus]
YAANSSSQLCSVDRTLPIHHLYSYATSSHTPPTRRLYSCAASRRHSVVYYLFILI